MSLSAGSGNWRTIAEARERSKNRRGAILFVALLLARAAWADSPEISARRLLSAWKGQEPSMAKLAEVIASAFASGLSWRGSLGGKEVFCPPPDLKGQKIMSAFEQFLQDNPDLAERPYGAL